MTVTKNSGNIEKFDIEKIKKVILWATNNLDVEPLKLESKIDIIFKPGISTKNIQHNLIHHAVTMTTLEEPDWRLVAGRLLMMHRWKKLKRNNKRYTPYYEFLKDMVKSGYYSNYILSIYSEEDIEEVETHISPSRDLIYDYAGTKALIDRYLLPDEPLQYAYMTISLLLASIESEQEGRIDYAIDFYNAISRRYISLATPILGNLRKPDGNLSSCFITIIEDSLESIMKVATQVAKVSKNGGGIGVNISNVRSKGATIKNVEGASGGIVPWIRILNDVAVAVNQLGKRAGACTVSLDIWHRDIKDFLELQTENGDQRTKAFDIFPQVVIPDLFMERVLGDGTWTLYDPNELKEVFSINLAENYGIEFNSLIKRLELPINAKKLKLTTTVSAKELLKHLMKVQIETGMPYIAFKDTINKVNPNHHCGYIPAVNLCVESFSNVSPSEVHTCNLLSINFALLNNKKELDYLCALAVRILDNTIELTNTPLIESENHNCRYRTIGIGVIGLADYIVKHDLTFNHPSLFSELDRLFESFSYYCTLHSTYLAMDRGAYPEFQFSYWDGNSFTGDTLIDKYKAQSSDKEKWEDLAKLINEYGIRNSQITAIAPNTSTSLIQGVSASVMPIFSKFYFDGNAKGPVPICPPFIKERPLAYIEYKDIDNFRMNKIISIIQKWIDTGISYEILYDLNNPKINAKYIYNIIIDAWKKKIKTMYYVRSIQKDSSLRTNDCVSCSN